MNASPPRGDLDGTTGSVSLGEAKKRRARKSTAPPQPTDIGEQVKALGHDRGVYYYLSKSGQQVRSLTAGSHTRLGLCDLASGAHYWERQELFRTKKGTDWASIADHLMDACRKVGIYDPDVIRGRGAWIDGGRSVLHLGDRLVVDGASQPLDLPDSRFVYEGARAVRIPVAAPLSTADARRLLSVCSMLRWERSVNAKLLAGWIAVAPICGALAWRPSVWLTGGAGAGKSWALENIIAPAVGPIALSAQSKTTEAYLRQILGSDARPVLLDEAEREDHASAARIQGVLDLMRQASSGNGAPIGKGSATGKPMEYRIRSAFLFQSINVGLSHHADESRVTVLTLRDAPKRETEDDRRQFAALRRAAEVITPAYSAGLVARSVQMIPTIRASAEIFAQAIAETLGSRRQGDQLGALLAGAWSLHSDDVVSPEQAREYILRDEFAGGVDPSDDSDETRCLRHLLAHRLRVAGADHPVGTLIEAVRFDGYERPSAMLGMDTADHALRQIGLRIGRRGAGDDDMGLFVSTNHPDLRRALRDTAWDASWGRTLARLPGAETGRKVVCRFSPTSVSRAVWVPIEVIEGGAE